jgi:hypothetical protein
VTSALLADTNVAARHSPSPDLNGWIDGRIHVKRAVGFAWTLSPEWRGAR